MGKVSTILLDIGFDWQEVETKSLKTFPVDESDDDEEQRDSEDEEENVGGRRKSFRKTSG
ncbi:hypothetical protein KIN20_028018 [Parelaphostrongylus tenuis]|uniref:Uncharacterized protein n=1 Tax=Parelaphostrongylus tenuis TaxID=148309 RepID=A0AAD5WEG7_PARTN|nr:hypothetical protein KIN20_028018 [Parelaphostrongylus tenuis]